MLNVLYRDDGSVHRRHIEQVEISGHSAPPEEEEDRVRTPLTIPPVILEETPPSPPADPEDHNPGNPERTDEIVLRRSSRVSKPPVRYRDFV